MGKIIAIGGGEMGRPKEDGVGFYPIETSSIDTEIIELTGKEHPRLLFIPTASHDSLGYSQLIEKYFLGLGCSSVGILNLSSETLSEQEIEDRILSYDAIYVGGGNTLRMMTVWRKRGVDKALKKAYSKDIVLSGLSAGSICWFNYGNSDSRKFTNDSKQFIKVTGLGLIDAVHCPHYDFEPERQEDLKRMMRKMPKLVAIALDNGAALEVIDDTYRIIVSKPGAKARRTYWKNGTYVIETIEVSDTLKDLSTLTRK